MNRQVYLNQFSRKLFLLIALVWLSTCSVPAPGITSLRELPARTRRLA